MRENPVRSGISPDARPNYNQTPHIADDELDKKVRKAVEKSEGQINRTSPSKLRHDPLDTYIHSYIKKEPVQGDQPLLYNISPHLRMENRFTPTLKVYSNINAGGSSQYNSQGPSHNIASSGVRSQANYYSNEGDRGYRYPQQNSANIRPNQERPYVNNPPSYGGYQDSSDRGNEGKDILCL